MTDDTKAGEEKCVIIDIGDYRFTKQPWSDRVWLEHTSGEGMELSPEMVDRFYKENF